LTIRVRHHQRNALKAFLEHNKIGCAIYYPKTLDQQISLKDRSTDKGLPTTHAHQLTNEVLSLPIYPGLPANAIDRVCDCIKAFFQSSKPALT
jgi:dTDP-4-amino-4,6-dideoxygalactose transaminase